MLLFVLLPNILVVSMAGDIVSVCQRTLYIIQSLALYGIGIFLLHRRAFLYMASLGFVFSAFELFHLFTRGKTLTVLYLYTWFKTSPEALNELYSPYIWYVLLGIVLWLLYYVVAHYFIEREYIAPLRWRIPLAAVMSVIYLALPLHVCPMNVLHQFRSLASIALHVENSQPQQRAFSYGIVPRMSKTQETVIVVIGETSYDQWQSLNYTDSLSIVFDSVYAECPVSGVAMPLLLSRATPQEHKPFFVEKSVIKAFDEADYYTAWLSDYGYHDHFLMRLADDCRYLSYLPDSPDTALLVPYREVMNQPSQRHMVVMVTQGGHDNSSLAQIPYLLHHLTDSLRTVHQPAMLVYVGSPVIRMKGDHFDLHVPMMMWANPNYRYRHRHLIRSLQSQRQWRISTASLFHSLLYWSGIECEQRNDTLAIGHEQFVSADTIRYLDENLQVKVFSPNP